MPGEIDSGAAAEVDTAPETEAQGDAGSEGQVSGDSVSDAIAEAADEADAAQKDAVEGEKPAAKEATPPAKQKFKLKDKEYDEDELLERIREAEGAKSLKEGSYKKFEEAAKMRKGAEALIDALAKDPEGALRYLHSIGKLERDPEDLAVEMLERRVKWEEMTPEERATEQMRREHAQLTQERQNAALRQQEQTDLAEQAKFEKQLDDDLSSVFKDAGVPKSISMMQRIAGRLRVFADQGQIPDTATVQLAGQQAVEDLKSEVGQLVANLPAQTLRKLFPDLVKKLHADDVARVLAKKTPPTANTVGKDGARPPPKKPEAKGFKSFREFRDEFYQPVPGQEV
jgi:hypothetical protein